MTVTLAFRVVSQVSMAKRQVQVDYAPVGPLRQRRRIKRAIVATAVVALSLLGYWYGPGLWHGARIMYSVRQCRTYSPGPDEVVYEEDPVGMRLLLASGRYVQSVASTRTNTQAAVRHDPNCLHALRAVAVDKIWGLHAANFKPSPGPGALPLLFLHERKTRNGKRFIVAIKRAETESGGWDGTEVATNYCYTLIAPRGMSPPEVVSYGVTSGGPAFPIALPIGPGDPPRYPAPDRNSIRYFAGQIDPDDESRLYLSYETDGVRGHVAARLLDDSKTSAGAVLVVEKASRHQAFDFQGFSMQESSRELLWPHPGTTLIDVE